MITFLYDRTFDGILTAVFDAFFRNTFPEALQGEKKPLPLFCEETYTIITDETKAERVWKALQKKLSATALSCLTVSYQSELPELDMHLFRYICKAVKSPHSIETNFADTDVLTVTNVFKKVKFERLRMMQFLRFQKAKDGTYLAVINPDYNVLPLIVPHFKDRFSDQQWLIYDARRHYGCFYDLNKVINITFENGEQLFQLQDGKINENLLEKDEKLFQDLWRTYFKAICIKERLNPRKHKQDMPVRYWKYLTEKQ